MGKVKTKNPKQKPPHKQTKLVLCDWFEIISIRTPQCFGFICSFLNFIKIYKTANANLYIIVYYCKIFDLEITESSLNYVLVN